MCFSVPLQVKKIDKDKLEMENGRVVKSVLTTKPQIGDYLVCQHDLAVEKISKKQAVTMRQAIKGVSDEIRS